MNIIVQKFGGTSVRDADSRYRALRHVKKAVDDNNKVVVVVSAMGRKGEPYATDSLLNLADVSFMSKREQDILLSCGEKISSVVFSNLLNSKGIKSCALTGAEAGFYTNNEHTNAKIIEMKCERLLNELENHDVVVVAGFQGISEKGEITTLGRGGSDTSAAALGAALNAESIQIFTDVEGVMTADPRIVEDAQPLAVVTYDEICNLAHEGAKVIHPRAVEIAKQAKVPIHVRSTYSDSPGTIVTSSITRNKTSDISERLVTGIAHVPNISQITVFSNDDEYLQANVFKTMANKGISVDFINISPTSIVYTVKNQMTDLAIKALTELGYEIKVERNCTKVSAVGAGMTGVPGVTAKIVNSLINEGIEILQSADSHTTIWVLVRGKDTVLAVNALHRAFHLNEQQA